ncbi:diacylglycerol kinase [Streptococcus pneumoniae]|nr:diacylglycerol kinase [Streptococcus pneumoniae]
MDSQDNKRKWKNRDLISSLEFAITGIFTAIKEERNMRKHAVTALVVILAGFGFQVSRIEWLFLLLSIFLVVAFEIINSAIENVVDLASHYHFSMLAKNAKDMAAGAVLGGFSFCSLNRRIDFSPTNLGFIILNSKRKL